MIVLLLVLAMALCLSACGCKHVWTEATCTAPKTCTECGETEGEVLAHNWAEANCTDPKTCTLCSTTEGAALGHNWSEATCQTAKTCNVCSAVEGEPLEHQVKWQLCEDTTDSMEGTCAVCSEQLTAETDWAMVADSRIIGTWRSVLLTNSETSSMSKYYDDFAEFREDGTGTIVMMGNPFEITWAFEKFDETYLHYTSYLIKLDGEDLRATFLGPNAVNLSLYYDPIRLDFVRVDYSYEDMIS